MTEAPFISIRKVSRRFGDVVVRGVPQPEARVVDDSWFEHTVRCVVPDTPNVDTQALMGESDGSFFAPPTVVHGGGGSVPLSVSLGKIAAGIAAAGGDEV